jgi:hypothetical protein
VSALERLTDSVAALGAPCRHHKRESEISEAVDRWAARLVPDPGPARFGEMASRAFPETDEADVVLFGQWLVWLFAFDDLRDDGPIGRDERATDRLYASVMAGDTTVAVARTFAELWDQTAPRATTGWRQGFQRHMAQHRSACCCEARFRQAGRSPTIHEYAFLRRRANGPFMFDLAEPILGVRLPDGLRRTRPWQALLEACNDVTAWCNDIASAGKERARGDVHNYVLVIAQEHGVGLDTATDAVLDRIAERVTDLEEAARALPAEFARLELGHKAARDASRVAVTLLGAPRGHLEWLLESARYRTDSAMAMASSRAAMPSRR